MRFCQVWRHRNKFSNFLASIALSAPDSDCTRLECIDGITHSGVFGASPDRTYDGGSSVAAFAAPELPRELAYTPGADRRTVVARRQAGHGAGDMGGADALQFEPIANALVDNPPQLLGEHDPGVVRCEWRNFGELPGNFMGARKQCPQAVAPLR